MQSDRRNLPGWARHTINTLLAVLIICLSCSVFVFWTVVDTGVVAATVWSVGCAIVMWMVIVAFKAINPE